jgi:hypothetical protein
MQLERVDNKFIRIWVSDLWKTLSVSNIMVDIGIKNVIRIAESCPVACLDISVFQSSLSATRQYYA